MPVLNSKKERCIIKLLEKGCGPREIMLTENVSYSPIRRLINKTGISPLQYRNTRAEMMLAEPQFICPGIGNCGTCKHPFQFPCKIGYDS